MKRNRTEFLLFFKNFIVNVECTCHVDHVVRQIRKKKKRKIRFPPPTTSITGDRKLSSKTRKGEKPFGLHRKCVGYRGGGRREREREMTRLSRELLSATARLATKRPTTGREKRDVGIVVERHRTPCTYAGNVHTRSWLKRRRQRREERTRAHRTGATEPAV